MVCSSGLEDTLASFTARSPRRDAEVDANRFAPLKVSLDAIIQEVAAERSGIVKRVKRTLSDPQSPAHSWTSGRKPRLSKTEFVILEDRLTALDRQLAELYKIETFLLEFEPT